LGGGEQPWNGGRKKGIHASGWEEDWKGRDKGGGTGLVRRMRAKMRGRVKGKTIKQGGKRKSKN